MEPIIDPVRKPLLKAELSQDRFLLESNRGGNLLYVVDNACAPNVVREIGRLREIAFRSRNSGTGKSCDLDRFDLDPAYHFHQLVLWDPAAEEIMGGYRFVCGDEVLFGEDGQPLIPSAHQFVFSEAFLQDGFRRTIELSRSFVALDFQNVQNSIRGVFALDSLLEGVKTILGRSGGRMENFFGKMGISGSFPEEGKDMILYFLEKHFGGPDARALVRSRPDVPIRERERWERLFTADTFQADYRILKAEMKKTGQFIPPLVNTYMKMSPTMKYFGSAINESFSGDIESAILIRYKDIPACKVDRYCDDILIR